MATAIGMNMRMTASIDKFQKSMDAVDRKLDRIAKSSKKTAGGLKTLATIEIGKLIGAGLTKLSAGFMRAGRAALDFADTQRQVADQIGKLSSQTGMGVESLQVLQQIAEYAGLSLEDFEKASQKMSRSLGDASNGLGLAGDALEDMGLDLNALLRLKPAQQFIVIGQALDSIEDPAKKSAAAAAIFGRNGMTMIPMFDGIQEAAAKTSVEMEKLGLILSTKQVRSIEAMNDSFTTTVNIVKKVGTQILGNIAPAITKANEELVKFVKNFKYGNAEGGAALAKYITNAFMDGAIALAKWVDYMADAFVTAYNFFQGLFEKLYDFVSSTLGVNKSQSEGGKEAEERIRHITGHLETLRDNLKQTHEYIETWGDMTGAQQERVKKYERDISLYESQLVDAKKDMVRAEKQYYEGKREAIFGQKSLTEMMIAMKQSINTEADTIGEGVKRLGESTQAYGDAARETTGAVQEKTEKVNLVTQALEGMKNAADKQVPATELFGKNVGISGEALRQLALDAEHDKLVSEQARRGFEDFRTEAEIAADNIKMAADGMVVGFKDATQVVGSFKNATERSMQSWDAEAEVRMKMYQQMGFNHDWLKERMAWERSNVKSNYERREQMWTKAHAKRAAAQADYEKRKIAGAETNASKRLALETSQIETAFNSLKGWWEKVTTADPTTNQGNAAETKIASEATTQTSLLGDILSAISSGQDFIQTAIM